jgi:hypothetical protein
MIAKFTSLLIVLLTVAMAAPLCAADNPLKPFRAKYIAEHDGDIVANTHLSLTRIGDNRWRYRSQSVPTGWIASMMGLEIEEESEWTWNDHIRTNRYRYDRAGKEKHVNLIFDWEKMKVTNVINGDPWHMQVPAGTQDKLSINLALRAHLSQSETDVSVPVADGGKLKTYDFKVIGHETIETPLGELNTLKVSRNKRGRKDKEAIMWLSPDLGYLLVKMEKADKDDEIVTLKIQELE